MASRWFKHSHWGIPNPTDRIRTLEGWYHNTNTTLSQPEHKRIWRRGRTHLGSTAGTQTLECSMPYMPISWGGGLGGLSGAAVRQSQYVVVYGVGFGDEFRAPRKHRQARSASDEVAATRSHVRLTRSRRLGAFGRRSSRFRAEDRGRRGPRVRAWSRWPFS